MKKQLFFISTLIFLSSAIWAATPLATVNILVLTDFHFDPFAACKGTVPTPCAVISKLKAARTEDWSKILTANDILPAEYRSDTNYQLLISTLREAKAAAAKEDVQFALILGDFISHDFRRQYKRYSKDASRAGFESFVSKTLKFLTQEVEKTFPQLDVYMVVGNNDSFHRDYYSNPNGLFFQQMASEWSSLIKNPENRTAMRTQFPTAGYYAVDLPQFAKVRLLVLNSVLLSNKAQGKNIEKAAQAEMNWLHQQLENAKQSHKHVLIAMHIPEGIDIYSSMRIRLLRVLELWMPSYSQQFQDDLKMFAPQIAGLFAGHLHTNWLHVLRFDNLVEIPFMGTAAVSPVYGNDPGFRIYKFNAEDFKLNDFLTYRYPLRSTMTWQVSTKKVSQMRV